MPDTATAIRNGQQLLDERVAKLKTVSAANELLRSDKGAIKPVRTQRAGPGPGSGAIRGSALRWVSRPHGASAIATGSTPMISGSGLLAASHAPRPPLHARPGAQRRAHRRLFSTPRLAAGIHRRACPRWDGTEHIEHAFCDAWGAPDGELARAASRNFFVAMIARALQPGAKVDTLFVFEGPQGMGKSRRTACAWGQPSRRDHLGDRHRRLHARAHWHLAGRARRARLVAGPRGFDR